jgi:hypothetical protein
MVGVPSVLGLEEGEYVVVGDARRGGYWFADVRDGEIITGPMVLTREELEPRLSGGSPRRRKFEIRNSKFEESAAAQGSRLAEGGVPVFSSEELGLPGVQSRFPQVDRLGRLAVAGRGVWARGVLEPIYLREPHITSPKAIDDCRSKMND